MPPGESHVLGLVGRSAVGTFSSSVNGLRISGLVGNASMYSLPPPVPPPARPRGTAKPLAVSANMPAPPALSLSMSRRDRRILSNRSIFPPRKLAQVDASPPSGRRHLLTQRGAGLPPIGRPGRARTVRLGVSSIVPRAYGHGTGRTTETKCEITRTSVTRVTLPSTHVFDGGHAVSAIDSHPAEMTHGIVAWLTGRARAEPNRRERTTCRSPTLKRSRAQRAAGSSRDDGTPVGRMHASNEKGPQMRASA